MKKKILYIFLLITMLITLASCEQINKFKDLVPKFEGKLPNVISGKFVYFASEEKKEEGMYHTLYMFNSKEMTFTKETDKGIERGSYSYKYNKFNITECNGTITFNYDDGRVVVSNFYYVATAVNGPDFMRIDGKTYYYWGT